MRKRLQVLMSDQDLIEIQRLARSEHKTLRE